MFKDQDEDDYGNTWKEPGNQGDPQLKDLISLVEANEAAVASVAELGVVLLMFVIGLEFNLPKLMGMRRMVFGFGMAQVLVMVLGR